VIGHGDSIVRFSGVTDVIGGATDPVTGENPREKLQRLFPNKLIIELPGAKKDLGIQPVELTLPENIPCPTGTTVSTGE